MIRFLLFCILVFEVSTLPHDIQGCAQEDARVYTCFKLAPKNLDRVHSPETFEALKLNLNKFFNCLPTNITCDKNNDMLNGFKFKIALVEKVSKVYSCVGEGNYSAATRACFKLPSGVNKCQNEEYYDCVRTELMKSNKCSSLEEQFFRDIAKDMIEGCRMESDFMNKYHPSS